MEMILRSFRTGGLYSCFASSLPRVCMQTLLAKSRFANLETPSTTHSPPLKGLFTASYTARSVLTLPWTLKKEEGMDTGEEIYWKTLSFFCCRLMWQFYLSLYVSLFEYFFSLCRMYSLRVHCARWWEIKVESNKTTAKNVGHFQYSNISLKN
jgi:hypothetical protein